MKKFYIRGVFLLLTISISTTSWAWYDRTHITIAKAAGYKYWYNAAGADITKIKVGGLEEYNHYFNNDKNVNVTSNMVLDQITRYNDPNDEDGHLYGAIIASIQDFKKNKEAGKFAEYYMAFAVHYIGDLSQPLHNVLYDNFNKMHHLTNDGIVDDEVLDKINEIQKYMYEINLRTSNFNKDLAQEIARIANISHKLGLKLSAENRNMTKEEAYTQLGHSASLLRAVLKSLGES